MFLMLGKRKTDRLGTTVSKTQFVIYLHLEFDGCSNFHVQIKEIATYALKLHRKLFSCGVTPSKHSVGVEKMRGALVETRPPCQVISFNGSFEQVETVKCVCIQSFES